jgi:hypothetical protein
MLGLMCENTCEWVLFKDGTDGRNTGYRKYLLDFIAINDLDSELNTKPEL